MPIDFSKVTPVDPKSPEGQRRLAELGITTTGSNALAGIPAQRIQPGRDRLGMPISVPSIPGGVPSIPGGVPVSGSGGANLPSQQPNKGFLRRRKEEIRGAADAAARDALQNLSFRAQGQGVTSGQFAAIASNIQSDAVSASERTFSDLEESERRRAEDMAFREREFLEGGRRFDIGTGLDRERLGLAGGDLALRTLLARQSGQQAQFGQALDLFGLLSQFGDISSLPPEMLGGLFGSGSFGSAPVSGGGYRTQNLPGGGQSLTRAAQPFSMVAPQPVAPSPPRFDTTQIGRGNISSGRSGFGR